MEDSNPRPARIAAIYARVSTDHQRAQGTIQSQVDELRELAVARELVVGSELVFCDEGISGATLVRPALESLRDGAAEGSFEVLLCHSADRLARRYAYQVLLLDELSRAGVKVTFASGDERSETPEGELLRQMQGMIAEYERAQIAERTRRGRLHRARSGSPAVLGRAPYGYRYMRRAVHADAYFQIDEVKAGVVREVFRRYAHEGQTLAGIADWLNETSTPTTTPGKAWHPSTVRGMLVNPAYRGEAAFGKTRVTGARGKATRQARQRGARQSLSPQRTSVPEDSWSMIAVPAIIDLDTFALARSRLEQGVRFAARNARKPSLLRGLLVCRECGYAWHRVEKGKSKRVFYQCGSRCLRTTERRCNTKPVPAGDLEQLVCGERSHACSANQTWSAPRSIAGCEPCARPTLPSAGARRSRPNSPGLSARSPGSSTPTRTSRSPSTSSALACPSYAAANRRCAPNKKRSTPRSITPPTTSSSPTALRPSPAA